VVVIGQVMPIKLVDMVPVIEGWLRVSAQEGHADPVRDAPQLHHQRSLYHGCNCSMRFPDMRGWPPISRTTSWTARCPVRRPELQSLIAKVLERSDSFQGRVRRADRFRWR